MFNTSLIKNIKTEKIWGNLRNVNLNLCSDSRKYFEGQLFFAIKGARFDGFNFAEDLISKNCKIIIFEETKESIEKAELYHRENPDLCLISVSDCLIALQELARVRLEQWRKDKLVIGITGSNGKTTHKELLYNILENVFPGKIICTQGNLNNHIGVPLTILSVEDVHEVIIIEMGTNHPGEIPLLCELVNPDSGIITNIGASHLEFFKSEEGVFKEKRSLFDFVKKRNTGFFIANAEDKFLCKLKEYYGLHFFSKNKKSSKNIIYYKLSLNKLTIEWEKSEIILENPYLFGDYNFRNLLACFLLSLFHFKNKKEDLINAANKVGLPANNRSTWIKKNKKEIFLDAYNANPSSMLVALTAYAQKLKREGIDFNQVTIIVGDMNELGELAESAHKELGQVISSLGYINVIFIGQYKDYFIQGLQTKLAYNSLKDLISSPPAEFTQAKYLFIKGSRSLQLETLVDIV